MGARTKPREEKAAFYVDEAGDFTLFDRKGRSLIGAEGVSDCFYIGVAQIASPAAAAGALHALRTQLLDDPYFAGVPSMRKDGRKTALAFHAKDDLPEVRREVLRLLPSLGVKVHVIIRRKAALVDEARALYKYGRKLRVNDVYDDMVKRVFRNLLHRAGENQIVFARRGTSDRSKSLAVAIRLAKQNFAHKWGVNHDVPTTITSALPHEHAGLQIIDYYLWAIQRLYQLREDRYFNLLERDYRIIMDMDDKRSKPYGAWYSPHNRLSLEKMNAP